jgi:hypothetical protein
MECARCGAHTFDTKCGNCWSMHLRPVAGFEARGIGVLGPAGGRFARPLTVRAPEPRISSL